MPQVPIYDAPQVKAQALPDTQLRVNTPNLGAAVGQGLAAVSGAMQEKADQAQAAVTNEATRKVREDLNGLTEFVSTVKDPRNPKNWGGREGQSLQSWFEEQAKALIESQRNSVPQHSLDKFDMAVLPTAEAMRHTVATHESALFDQVYNETYDANTGSIRQSVALTAVDPKGRLNQAAVATSEAEIRQQVADIAKRNQWSPEKTRAEEIRQLSPTHASVVQGLLDAKNMESARAYFEKSKGDMTPEVMKTLGAKVEVGTDYEIGDNLYNKYIGGLTIENYAERQKQINQEESLKTRPHVRENLLQKLHAVVSADVAAKNAGSDAALDKVASVGFYKGPAAAMSSPEMQVLAKLDPSRAEQKKRQYEAEIRARSNESTPDDYTNALFTKVRLINSEGFLFMTEQQLRNEIVGMPKPMQAETVAYWSQYKNDAKAWEGDKKLVMDELYRAGLIKDPEKFATKGAEATREHAAYNALAGALGATFRGTGRAKPFTVEEQKKELSRLAGEFVISPGFIRDKKMKTFEITAKLEDPTYRPVRAQFVQTASNNGTGLNLEGMTTLYSRAMQEGKLLPSGFVDQKWLNNQPEILARKKPKYGELKLPTGLGDPMAELRKLAEGAK